MLMQRSMLGFVRALRCRLLAGTLSFAAGLPVARAEMEPEPSPGLSQPEPKTSDRVLLDHVFLTPTLVPSAFITTHFYLRQGLMYLEIPQFPFTAERTRDVQALNLTERLEAGVRLFEVFEIFVFGSAEILTGTNVESAIAAGSSFAYEAGGGGAVRLLRSRTGGTQLSVRAQGSAGTGSFIDVLGLLDAVIAQDPDTLDAIVDNGLGEVVLRDVYRRDAAGHVLLAQTLSANFGVQLSAGMAYRSVTADFFDLDLDRKVSEDDTTLAPDLGVAFDANGLPSIPVGVVLEYSLRTHSRQLAGDGSDWGGLAHLLAAGLYAAHPQLQLGVTFGSILGLEPIARRDTLGQRLVSGQPSVYYGQLAMNFNW
jgi:hypothetical protein